MIHAKSIEDLVAQWLRQDSSKLKDELRRWLYYEVAHKSCCDRDGVKHKLEFTSNDAFAQSPEASRALELVSHITSVDTVLLPHIDFDIIVRPHIVNNQPHSERYVWFPNHAALDQQSIACEFLPPTYEPNIHCVRNPYSIYPEVEAQITARIVDPILYNTASVPKLVIISGYPGSGKSTLAQAAWCQIFNEVIESPNESSKHLRRYTYDCSTLAAGIKDGPTKTMALTRFKLVYHYLNIVAAELSKVCQQPAQIMLVLDNVEALDIEDTEATSAAQKAAANTAVAKTARTAANTAQKQADTARTNAVANSGDVAKQTAATSAEAMATTTADEAEAAEADFVPVYLCRAKDFMKDVPKIGTSSIVTIAIVDWVESKEVATTYALYHTHKGSTPVSVPKGNKPGNRHLTNVKEIPMTAFEPPSYDYADVVIDALCDDIDVLATFIAQNTGMDNRQQTQVADKMREMSTENGAMYTVRNVMALVRDLAGTSDINGRIERVKPSNVVMAAKYKATILFIRKLPKGTTYVYDGTTGWNGKKNTTSDIKTLDNYFELLENHKQVLTDYDNKGDPIKNAEKSTKAMTDEDKEKTINKYWRDALNGIQFGNESSVKVGVQWVMRELEVGLGGKAQTKLPDLGPTGMLSSVYRFLSGLIE